MHEYERTENSNSRSPTGDFMNPSTPLATQQCLHHELIRCNVVTQASKILPRPLDDWILIRLKKFASRSSKMSFNLIRNICVRKFYSKFVCSNNSKISYLSLVRRKEPFEYFTRDESIRSFAQFCGGIRRTSK